MPMVLVGATGIEPVTFSMSRRHSPAELRARECGYMRHRTSTQVQRQEPFSRAFVTVRGTSRQFRHEPRQSAFRQPIDYSERLRCLELVQVCETFHVKVEIGLNLHAEYPQKASENQPLRLGSLPNFNATSTQIGDEKHILDPRKARFVLLDLGGF
jgi:hypothetical protein